MPGEPLTLRAQFVSFGVPAQREAGTRQQSGHLRCIGIQPHPTETVVGKPEMFLGRSGVIEHQLDDAGEVLDFEERMAQAQLGDGAPSGVDHPPGRGGPATERLQHSLTPGRRRFDRR